MPLPTVPVTQTTKLGVFVVPSTSRPGLVHVVEFRHGEAFCSCEAGTRGRGRCRHRDAVYAHLAGVESAAA